MKNGKDAPAVRDKLSGIVTYLTEDYSLKCLVYPDPVDLHV